jgi:hypothetical protein
MVFANKPVLGYGKSLFCFPDPVKKKELYLTWLTNLSIEESFTSDKHRFVCENHFETSCFEGNLMVILFIFLIILQSAILLNNVIKTILPRSIGLF